MSSTRLMGRAAFGFPLAVLSGLLALSGCGRTAPMAPRSPCGPVPCPAGTSCDPRVGRCSAEAHGGAPDASTVLDDGGVAQPCGGGCADHQLCDSLTDRCVECLVDAHCAVPDEVCDVPSGACVACQNCPPRQTSCELAKVVSLGGETSSASVTVTPGPLDDESSSCAISGSPEEVILVSLSAETDVTFSATSGRAFPALSLRTSPCRTGAELACSSERSPVFTRRLVPGHYYLLVESMGAERDAVLVTISTRIPTPSVNDSCDSVAALNFENGVATAGGNTAWATNEPPGSGSPNCSPSARESGKDVVYSYRLDAPSRVTITVTPTGGIPTLEPAVYVRAPGQCGSTELVHQLGCITQYAPVPAVLTIPEQPPGTYYVWVDGSRDTSGPFRIQVSQH